MNLDLSIYLIICKIRTHIYDTLRFNINLNSKNQDRRASDSKENTEIIYNNTSPIVLRFKDNEIINDCKGDENTINKINIETSSPNLIKKNENDKNKSNKQSGNVFLYESYKLNLEHKNSVNN